MGGRTLDLWVGGRMGGWKDGWVRNARVVMDQRGVGSWADKWVDAWVSGWKTGWMDGRVGGWRSGW